jgi:hypothetical protein
LFPFFFSFLYSLSFFLFSFSFPFLLSPGSSYPVHSGSGRHRAAAIQELRQRATEGRQPRRDGTASGTVSDGGLGGVAPAWRRAEQQLGRAWLQRLTDEAVARATAGREEAAVSTVWREGGAVAAPDSITDEFFCYDYWTTVASGAVENASPDSATAHFRRPVRQMWRPGLDSAA